MRVLNEATSTDRTPASTGMPARSARIQIISYMSVRHGALRTRGQSDGESVALRTRGKGHACVRDIATEHERCAQLGSDNRRRIATWDRLRLVAVDHGAARSLALRPEARAAAVEVLHREVGVRSSQAATCSQIGMRWRCCCACAGAVSGTMIVSAMWSACGPNPPPPE